MSTQLLTIIDHGPGKGDDHIMSAHVKLVGLDGSGRKVYAGTALGDEGSMQVGLVFRDDGSLLAIRFGGDSILAAKKSVDMHRKGYGSGHVDEHFNWVTPHQSQIEIEGYDETE